MLIQSQPKGRVLKWEQAQKNQRITPNQARTEASSNGIKKAQKIALCITAHGTPQMLVKTPGWLRHASRNQHRVGMHPAP
jgi:hypothetical protein